MTIEVATTAADVEALRPAWERLDGHVVAFLHLVIPFLVVG